MVAFVVVERALFGGHELITALNPSNIKTNGLSTNATILVVIISAVLLFHIGIVTIWLTHRTGWSFSGEPKK
jgi:hypothetical protein